MDNKQKKYDYLFKVLLLGEGAVGKTCILVRYIDNKFVKESMMSVGVDFKKNTLIIDNEKIVLQLWDTAGQDRFSAVTRQLFKGAQAIALVYSITDLQSYIKVNDWMNQIDQQVGKGIVKVLVGNKCDLENKRKVSTEDAKKLAQNNHYGFFESSAENNTNIKEIFDYLAQNLHSKAKREEIDNKAKGIKVDQNKTIKAGKKCCL